METGEILGVERLRKEEEIVIERESNKRGSYKKYK